jgi:hypothetical protein
METSVFAWYQLIYNMKGFHACEDSTTLSPLFFGGSHRNDTVYSGKCLAILEGEFSACVFHPEPA